MKAFMKRTVSLILAVLLVLTLAPALKTDAKAAGGLSLDQLKAKYPHGSYWNHYVNSTSEAADYLKQVNNESFSGKLSNTVCASHTNSSLSYYVGKYDCNYFDGGIQCCGFARKLAYEVYGTRASKWGKSNTVKPGDVVHFKSSVTDSTYGHWVFVYAVSGSKITVGECNIGSNRCQIRWGYTYDMNSFYSYTIYSAPYTLPVDGIHADVGTNFYGYIINTSRWKHLTDDGNNVSMRTETGDANQIWFFERLSDGSYSIKSAENKWALEVQDSGSHSGANVQTNPYTGSDAQKWYISGVSAKYQLRAKCTKCVLDVSSGASEDGTNIQMYESNNTDAQLFQIWPLREYIMKPTVITDKQVCDPGSTITLSWDDCLGATTYWINIWKNNTSGEHILSKNIGLVTNYKFTPQEPGQYYITVEACTDANGWVSAYSDGTTVFARDEKGKSFSDVPTGSWFEAPVLWALENGITDGTSATTFSPGNQCLRAHVVTFLWNAEKCPKPAAASSTFTDVPAGAWYEKPVLWAVEKGITSGVSPTKFGAGDVCSRYQVVFFLWKAAGSPEPKTTVNPFTDVNPGHFFYKAVLWAVENDITSGTSDTTFSPTQPCNRAQVVTFLYAAYT